MHGQEHTKFSQSLTVNFQYSDGTGKDRYCVGLKRTEKRNKQKNVGASCNM